jgi:hypothetical protein
MRNSFFIGNHHAISEEKREYFVNVIKSFVKEKAR